jgi:type IV secretion system protein TrbI
MSTMTPDSPSSSERVESTDDLHAARAMRGAIRDRRPVPHGPLPRQAQVWIMLGLAGLILLVILFTGRTEPTPRVTTATPAAMPAQVPPERVRSLQQRFAEQEQRTRDAQAPASIAPVDQQPSTIASPPAVDPVVEERRRRDAQSLFADNVAFTRRGSGSPVAPPSTGSAPPMWPYPVAPPTLVPAPAVPSAPSNPQALTSADDRSEVQQRQSAPSPTQTTTQTTAPPAEVDPRWTLLEGTVIEAVLINRLDGTFEGPVQCLVTTPVYSLDRQTVLISAGSRVLGSAVPVQAWGDRRLAVRFHRLLLPEGRTVSLDSLTGLNQVGETGLTDQVNRHYFQVFGASLAIGAISGLAQFGTRSGFDVSAADASRQAAGASLATSTARVLDRYLNVLPTITIREGHRIKIVLTADLRLPPSPRNAAGSPPPAAHSSKAAPIQSGGTR